MSLLEGTGAARFPIFICRNGEELARFSAAMWVKSMRETLKSKRWFDVALSGGSTPKRMYEILADEHSNCISWDRTRFFWGDERNVPPDHPDSNFKMAYTALLGPLKIPSENIFRIQTELGDVENAADEYENTLKRELENGCFDLVLMGLGEDGHTASLFPDAWVQWGAAEKQGRWTFAPWVPHLNQYRFTLLPRILNSTKKNIFLVAGASKSHILSQVMKRPLNKAPTFPAQLIHTDHGEALWLIDRLAAAELNQAA
jgi:6-phosphogluconolactonase